MRLMAQRATSVIIGAAGRREALSPSSIEGVRRGNACIDGAPRLGSAGLGVLSAGGRLHWLDDVSVLFHSQPLKSWA